MYLAPIYIGEPCDVSAAVGCSLYRLPHGVGSSGKAVRPCPLLGHN